MSKELTPMQSLQEKMQQHIKDKFAELVPEEIWKGLSDKVIQDFMDRELPKIINEELSLLCRTKIKATLQGEEFTDKWDKDGRLTSNGLKALLIEAAPEMFSRVFGEIAQRMIQQMRH